MKKKRLRDMTWEDYGISKNRYQELKAFCLQFNEKTEKIKRGLSAIKYKAAPGRTGTGKPTEQEAIRNSTYEEDCLMIVKAAQAADPEIFPYIIKSVTEDLPYKFVEYDNKLGRIPMGSTEFYARRRLFYYYLDKLKSGYKIDLIM